MYIRNCPQCGKEMSYTSKRYLTKAIENNTVCKSCYMKGKQNRLGKKGKLSEETRHKMSKTRKGKKLSEEHCRNISEAKQGEKNPLYGKSHSEESRRKMSISSGGNGELDRKWPGMQTWVRHVKKRDRCCQKCGCTEDLHAHHIKPRSKFPQHALDVNNGITLCKECHIYEHKHYRSTYG